MEVDAKWLLWRPVVMRMAKRWEMREMSLDEVMEFNAAIDRYIRENKEEGGG